MTGNSKSIIVVKHHQTHPPTEINTDDGMGEEKEEVDEVVCGTQLQFIALHHTRTQARAHTQAH